MVTAFVRSCPIACMEESYENEVEIMLCVSVAFRPEFGSRLAGSSVGELLSMPYYILVQWLCSYSKLTCPMSLYLLRVKLILLKSPVTQTIVEVLSTHSMPCHLA
jgi:hypothetical protein